MNRAQNDAAVAVAEAIAGSEAEFDKSPLPKRQERWE